MHTFTMIWLLGVVTAITASPIACSNRQALTSSVLNNIGISTIIKAIPCSSDKMATAQSGISISAQDLIDIAPSTASCSGAWYPGECRTAAIAAPHIARSFKQCRLDTFDIQAAAVAIMLYESGDFKYSKNHFPAPGRPGQGTRSMMSPAFVEEYVESISTIAGSGVTKAKVQAAKAKGAADVLALVDNDRWSFASAAWFISTQCSENVKQGLNAATEAGFERILMECVGTTVTEDRIAVWRKVMALGKW